MRPSVATKKGSDLAQLFHGAGHPDGTVPHKRHRLMCSFHVGVVERVLQHPGGTMIIFCGKDDIAVALRNLCLPPQALRILRRCPGVAGSVVEKGQRVLVQSASSRRMSSRAACISPINHSPACCTARMLRSEWKLTFRGAVSELGAQVAVPYVTSDGGHN